MLSVVNTILMTLVYCCSTDDWESLSSWPERHNVFELASFDAFTPIQELLHNSICNSKVFSFSESKVPCTTTYMYNV